MEIPVGVEVICGTQVCGRSMYIVINPVNDRVTHLVVAIKTFPHTKHLVPVDRIIKSTATSTQLRCSPTELAGMERFMETDFIKPDEVETSLPYGEPVLLWPYGSYRSDQMPLKYEYIPAGEVVIRDIIEAEPCQCKSRRYFARW